MWGFSIPNRDVAAFLRMNSAYPPDPPGTPASSPFSSFVNLRVVRTQSLQKGISILHWIKRADGKLEKLDISVFDDVDYLGGGEHCVYVSGLVLFTVKVIS